jgi:hypothetical protein
MPEREQVDQDGWATLLAFCESERRRIFAQLEPLEDGTVHTGTRDTNTGGVWVDTTTGDIQRLRKAVANIESTIAQIRGRKG